MAFLAGGMYKSGFKLESVFLRGRFLGLKMFGLDVSSVGFASGLSGSFRQFLLQLRSRAERDCVGRRRLRRLRHTVRWRRYLIRRRSRIYVANP